MPLALPFWLALGGIVLAASDLWRHFRHAA
jgi:hypothetical protein